jgi:hypothetical protein
MGTLGTIVTGVDFSEESVGATTTAQLVWILAARLPEPEVRVDEHRSTTS